jgi:D-alanine-D-alanine ligase
MKPSPHSVLILHENLGENARADEADALLQVSQVTEALEKLHWKVSTQAIDLDLAGGLQTLRDRQPGCVFNLVESLGGRGELIGLVPMLLESAAIPFTGSGSIAINLTSHKMLAKRFMRLDGIPTPDWRVDAGDSIADDESWIVKSLWEHASLGLDDGSVVRGRSAMESRMRHCAEIHGGLWFAERFVDGREFNISLIEQNGQPLVLPLAEMTFVDYPPGKPKIVSYAAKWDENAPEYRATERRFPELPDTERQNLQKVARRCWSLFGLRGFARVDVRVDPEGTPWVLEVNANPCLTRDAGFIAATVEAGMRYRQVIEMILHAAMRPALPVLRRVS